MIQVDIDSLFSHEDNFLSHTSMKTDKDIEITSKIFPSKTDESNITYGDSSVARTFMSI